jgi:NAD(P)-dependent dehydrogenase (short-subunit alcohol dehydrogenase family)
MDLKLKDKVAIVTGAASGMGRAIARMLVSEGVKVMIADLQEEKGNEVVYDIKQSGGEATFSNTNTSVRDDVNKMVASALSAYGQIDMLFNVAGPGAVGGQLDTDENEFNRQINGHLKGVFNCTQAVLPSMIEKKSGKIVNMASFAGHGVLDSIPAYSAAFGGILAYTKNVARWAAQYNININSVSPGNILTPMTINWLSEGDNMDKITATIPIRRIGAPEDVAAVCVFLGSDMARHLVGVDINVNGGQYI